MTQEYNNTEYYLTYYCRCHPISVRFTPEKRKGSKVWREPTDLRSRTDDIKCLHSAID